MPRPARRVWHVAVLALGLAAAAPLAAADEQGWRLEPDARIDVQAVSAQTTTRDEDLVIDGEALSVRGQIGLGIESKRTRVRLEADRIEVFRLGEDRRDVSRDRLTANIEHDLTDTLEVQAQLRRYDDLVTVESPRYRQLGILRARNRRADAGEPLPPAGHLARAAVRQRRRAGDHG